MSAKMQGLDRVAVCFFGDGASNQGIFHESLNLASIWDLPVVYVCENNQYGISLSRSRSMAVENVARRAEAYAMPGQTVDGNDVLVVFDAVRRAVARARNGDGPSLIECETYRWRGHHVGDPGTDYRTADEVQEWKVHCPIARFRAWLIDHGQLTAEDADEVVAEQEDAVRKAVDFAKASPFPPVESVEADVYAD